jgi:hypothetical protein
MTAATSSPVVRFGRRIAELLPDTDYAQRRMVEINVGVQSPARRDRDARRSCVTGTEPRRASSDDDGAVAGLMC